MKHFADLCLLIERTNSSEEKVRAVRRALDLLQPAEAAWCVYLLIGKKLRTFVKINTLRQWAQEAAKIPTWLFEECYANVGDLAETIALILPKQPSPVEPKSFFFWIEQLRELEHDEQAHHRLVLSAWMQMCDAERIIFNKIISGMFRPAISQQQIVQAISEATGLNKQLIAQRLAVDWLPSSQFFQSLCDPNGSDLNNTSPYEFCEIESTYELECEMVEDPNNWLIEWEWTGLHSQLIKRTGCIAIWNVDGELLTNKFPELVQEAKALPDGTVLEGFILPWQDSDVMPFELLKQRISRKNITQKLQGDIPVVFMASDLLEEEGHDICAMPIELRRKRLIDTLSSRSRMSSTEEFEQLKLFAPCRRQLSTVLRVSPTIEASNREQLNKLQADSRRMKADGLRMTLRGSRYGQAGSRFIWKAAPFKLHAVLVAAQTKADSRSYLLTDYTFAIWNEKELVPFVKASSASNSSQQQHELSQTDIQEIDSFVRKNTLARFGPVYTVKPELVFELSFESIQVSVKSRSGIAVRLPRILQLKTDKSVNDADSVQSINQLLNQNH